MNEWLKAFLDEKNEHDIVEALQALNKSLAPVMSKKVEPDSKEVNLSKMCSDRIFGEYSENMAKLLCITTGKKIVSDKATRPEWNVPEMHGAIFVPIVTYGEYERDVPCMQADEDRCVISNGDLLGHAIMDKTHMKLATNKQIENFVHEAWAMSPKNDGNRIIQRIQAYVKKKVPK